MREFHTNLLHRLLVVALLAPILTLALAGCGTVRKAMDAVIGDPDYPRTQLLNIAVVAEAHANLDSATQLDIVFVYDRKAIEMVPKTAGEWFQSRDTLLRRLPGKMEAVSLQIPPSYIIDEVELPNRFDKAISVTAFANYLSKQGLIPIDLTPMEKPLLTLQEAGIEVADLGKGE